MVSRCFIYSDVFLKRGHPFIYFYHELKKKVILTFKMVRKTLVKTAAIGARTITMGERDQAQLGIQYKQLRHYSQGAELGDW